MITIHCTRVLQARWGLGPPWPATVEPTTALGHWYLHLARLGREQLVLATSERSLLTVVLPARGLRDGLPDRLRAAVGALLRRLDLPESAVRRELDQMADVCFAPATNRRVIGSLNELALQLHVHATRTRDATDLAAQLSDTPMSAVGRKSHYGIPREVARELLIAGAGQGRRS
jgi:hypothetical protein